MAVSKEIWHRDQFLTAKLVGSLGWLSNIAFAGLEISEAVTDFDSIVLATITCIRNLLVLIGDQDCGSDAWNSKKKRSQS